MIIEKETVTPQIVLELVQAPSSDDLSWLLEQLHGLTDDAPLPEEITLDAAVD